MSVVEDQLIEGVYRVAHDLELLTAQIEDTNRRLDSISVVLSEIAETLRQKDAE